MAIGKINGVALASSGGGGADRVMYSSSTFFNNSSTNWNFFNRYSNFDSTSAQWYTQFLVPKDGQITNCTVSIQNARSATFGVWKNITLFNTPGSTGTPTYSQAITSTGSNTVYTFSLTTNSFSAGDRIGFAMKSDGTGTLAYSNMDILFEFT